MPRHLDAQLVFDFAPGGASPGPFSATRALRRHRRLGAVLQKLHYVRRFFPELGDRTVRVGITRAAAGMAVPGGFEIWLNPSQLSHHAIAHEFVHLLQGKHGIPTGEKSCDLFSLARHWTLNDTMPCYVRVPAVFGDTSGRIPPRHARLIFAAARRALERRNSGTRYYIAHFERSLEDLSDTCQRVSLGGSRTTALKVDDLFVSPERNPLDEAHRDELFDGRRRFPLDRGKR